jgi:hypothetical protein
LVVNAMPRGGQLMIETTVVVLDASDAPSHSRRTIAFIQKPVTPEPLGRNVRKVLGVAASTS